MIYPAFLLIAAIEMLVELWISTRNSSELLRKGAVEIAPQILPFMMLLYILLFAGSFGEYLLIPKEVHLWWGILFIILFLLAKGLKFWAVKALGTNWTMKVLIIPESKVVSGGPYRWIRHPNYFAVLMEIAAMTLLGKNWITFTIVFLSFVAILFYRIRAEEAALLQYTDYSMKMTAKNRFLP